MKRLPAQCPFLKQQCIGERCELWQTLKLTRPGPMVGINAEIEAEGCVFNLLLLPMSLPPVILPRKRPPSNLSPQ